jgi:carbon storage regulator
LRDRSDKSFVQALRSADPGSVMLILTRRVNESVMIGDDVRVTVLGVKNGQVRIGITAPKSIAVHRQEVYERIRSGQSCPSPATVPLRATES